jgi:predicted transcriptional regulator
LNADRDQRPEASVLDLLLGIDARLLRAIATTPLRHQTFATVVRHAPVHPQRVAQLAGGEPAAVAYHLRVLHAIGALNSSAATAVEIAPARWIAQQSTALASVSASLCDALGDHAARLLVACLQDSSDEGPVTIAQLSLRIKMPSESSYRRCLQLATVEAISMIFDDDHSEPIDRWSGALAETVHVALLPRLFQPPTSAFEPKR